MERYKKWDDYVDSSDEEELAGGRPERAHYNVVGDVVAVLREPRQDAAVLELKERGETIQCDARKDNWVRLIEEFPLRGCDHGRGWAMIDGSGLGKPGVGLLLSKVERQPRPKPQAAATAAPPIAAPPPKRIPAQLAEAPPSQRPFDQSKWNEVVKDIPDPPPPPAQKDPCLRPMNPAAMHQYGYCWSELQPPYNDPIAPIREKIRKHQEKMMAEGKMSQEEIDRLAMAWQDPAPQ